MANLFENILSWNLWNQAFDFFRGTNPEDPTTSGLYKTIQWWANLYTWLSQELKTWWQQDFEIKKQKARQFLQSKWYDSATIENSLSQIEYKPSYMQRVKEGLWTRMEEVARTTENLSNQPLTKRLWAWTLSYWWDVVATAFEPVTSAISPYAQKWLEYTWLDKPLAKGMQEWEEIRQKYPTFADTVEWAFNVSQIFAPKAWVKTWQVVKTGAEMVKKPIVATGKQLTKVPWAISEWAGTITETAISQASWLGRESVQNIIKSPELFKKARIWEITRETELANASLAIEKRLSDLSELWKGYEAVRKTNVTIPKTEVSGIVSKSLDELWFERLNDGNPNLIDLPIQDRRAIEQAMKYVNEYKGDLTAKNALSLRQKLDSLVDWKSDATPAWERVVQNIRRNLDSYIGERIPWLKQLDAQYWPEKEFLRQVRKSIYNKDGTIKDNALSTIWNITGKWKENMLARLEEITPWIWERIKALKAFEDVQNSSGIKVWTYTRNIWTVALGTVNPLVALAWWITTHPVIVSRLLETYGVAKGKIQEILKSKKLSKDNASIVQKAVKETPKEEVEKIITNLSYDPKTNRLTSGNIWPKKLTTMWKIKSQPLKESVVAKETWYTMGIKKPIVKRSADIESGLIEEARKYKSAEEFVKAKLPEYKKFENDSEFTKYHITGIIPSSAYKDYWVKWWLDFFWKTEKNPILVKTLKIGDENISFRKRNNKDSAISVINSKNEVIWWASNEFWADWVWIINDYQWKWIWTKLLREFRKQFSPDRKIWQATESGYMLAKKYYKELESEASKLKQIYEQAHKK